MPRARSPEVGGLARVDRENGGEAQLADDFDELRFAVGVAAVIGRDHNVNTSVMLHLIINYRGKKNDCQISVRVRRSADKTYQQKNCISEFFMSQTTLAIPKQQNSFKQVKPKTIVGKGENHYVQQEQQQAQHPRGQGAMNKFKMEVAKEIGVDLKDGYNGDLTSAQSGSIGGEMVRQMIKKQEQQMSGKYQSDQMDMR